LKPVATATATAKNRSYAVAVAVVTNFLIWQPAAVAVARLKTGHNQTFKL
jgi:hypothetical protein